MSVETIGWVMDKATSTRGLHLYLIGNGEGLGVCLEVSGQQPAIVELEVEDVVYLQEMLAQALKRLKATGSGSSAGAQEG